MVSIIRAGASDFSRAQAIVKEYQESVPVVVQDDPAAIAAYLADPYGLWLGVTNSQAVACLALRPLPCMGSQAAEVKRLYVRPAFRGRGLADTLLDALEEYARTHGFTKIYLDSKDDMHSALRFYRRRGYLPVERYNDNPQATIFLAKPIG